MDWTTIIGYIFSAVTGAAGYLTGTKMRRNTAVQQLQETINTLASKNDEYYDRIIRMQDEMTKLRAEHAESMAKLQAENADLKSGQEQLLARIASLEKENRLLTESVNRLKLNQ